MLEIRRRSNDSRAIGRLGLWTMFAILFVAGAYLFSARLVVTLLLLVPALVACLAIVRLAREVLLPCEYVCQFYTDRVQWWTTRQPAALSVVRVSGIHQVEINFDDLSICWSAGSMLARGVGVDINWSEHHLREMLDWMLREWRAVRIFVIETGVRREVTCQ